MIKFRQKRLSIRPVPLVKLLPNFVTLIGLIIGVSSIRFALDSRWEVAVFCVLIATIIDGLDGRVARFLNATSHFGAELDSLCDFVNFGICPAMLIYLWSFQQYEYKLISWACIVFYILCVGIRLARFNTAIIEPRDSGFSDSFFVGVPSPVGALLALIPMIMDFEISLWFDNFSFRNHTVLIDLYILIIAALLPSRLPTISLKKVHIKPEYLALSMIISSIVIVALVIYTWYALPIAAVLYFISIPVIYYSTKKRNKDYARK